MLPPLEWPLNGDDYTSDGMWGRQPEES